MTKVYRRLRVLGFEPYDAGSHRLVRKLVDRHSRHAWTWITRPGRGWKWRMRLAAVEMLEDAQRRGLLGERVDAIFATSLLGAADLRALLPPALRNVPLILYMHENQASYPLSNHPKVEPGRDVHFALTNLTGILAADLVLWNSRWNLESFLQGMTAILQKASAAGVGPGWRARVEARSRVAWPPVEPPPGGRRVLHNCGRGPVRVVWPHRWEHDKGPDELLETALRHSEELDLRWTILGERFPETPPALLEFEKRLAHRIDRFGWEPSRRRYWEHLRGCDWVLSTARHEYFGVAVVEALLSGCLPWLPPRLSYPELLPPAARRLEPGRPPRDPDAVSRAICAHLAPAVAPEAVAVIDHAIAGAT